MYNFLSIGKDCTIWPGANIAGAENIWVGNAVMIDSLTFLYAKKRIRIGDFAHIGGYSSITGGEECEIGPVTSLSWGVRVFTATENLEWLFGPNIPPEYRHAIREKVHIGKHVLIGANSVILPGAVIHDGAVIGAGSVVRKGQEIAPWSVWGGVPAHFIRSRDALPVFEAEQELMGRFYRGGVYVGKV